MGFWSSVSHFIKAVVRVVVRVVITVVHTFVPNVLDFLFGFLAWPQKKMRIQIFVLKDSSTGKPVYSGGNMQASIQYAIDTFKSQFNVKVISYSVDWVIQLTDTPPADALTPGCGGPLFEQEFGDAGEYYSSHIAGWNAIPISLTYPISVFVVREVIGKIGCSLGPLTDYVVISPEGIDSINTMAHEIGHCCSLWHSGTKSNLMWRNDDRGSGSKWFQRNLLRSSRHVNYY